MAIEVTNEMLKAGAKIARDAFGYTYSAEHIANLILTAALADAPDPWERIRKLESALLGIEIAISRDGNGDAAFKIALDARKETA